MTCSRCGAEFCWICRGEFRRQAFNSPYNISFRLSCIYHMEETAITWFFVMIIGLIFFSPFHIFFEINVMLGQVLKRLFMEKIAPDLDQNDNSGGARIILGSIMLLGLALLPVTLAMFCMIYPLVVLCRLWQIL